MFWALTKATLLVSGSRRMKPHSLCMGLCVSGWKALNEKLSMGWPTCEMCASSRYRKGCSVGKVPAPGGSDSQVPSIQDSGSTTGLILGGSVDREGRQRLLLAVLGSLAWIVHHVPAGPGHHSSTRKA